LFHLIFLYSLPAFLIRRSRSFGRPLSLFALDRWLRYNVYDFVFFLDLTVCDSKDLIFVTINFIPCFSTTKKKV